MIMRACRLAALLSLSLISGFVLAACITTDHLYLGNERYAPRPLQGSVEFLADAPSKAFTKIAVVEAWAAQPAPVGMKYEPPSERKPRRSVPMRSWTYPWVPIWSAASLAIAVW